MLFEGNKLFLFHPTFTLYFTCSNANTNQFPYLLLAVALAGSALDAEPIIAPRIVLWAVLVLHALFKGAWKIHHFDHGKDTNVFYP